MIHGRPRFSAILAGLLLLFGSFRGMAGTQCAVHSAGGPGRSGTVQDGHEHAGHGAHTAPAPEQAAHHESCTCLEHCQSCQATGFVAVAPRLPGTAFFMDAAATIVAPASRVAARLEYRLPFATAPPALA